MALVSDGWSTAGSRTQAEGSDGSPGAGPRPQDGGGVPQALYLLADEFHLTTADALDLCDRAGIEADSGATPISAADAERFRGVATTPEVDDAPAHAWAIPANHLPGGAVAPSPSPSPAFATGPKPWAPPVLDPPAASAPSAGPAEGAATASAAVTVDPDLLRKLGRARALGQRAMMRGVAVLAIGMLVTIGTFTVAHAAGGGIFIISIGALIGGPTQIWKGWEYRQEVRRIERALRR